MSGLFMFIFLHVRNVKYGATILFFNDTE